MNDQTGRVVVGYDGSPSAQAAVDWAVDEASRRQLPLTVVYVADYTGLVGGPAVPYPAPAVSLTGGPVEASEEWWVRAGHSAQRVSGAGVARARERNGDVDVAVETVTGSAKRVLVEASQGATVLVVGTRGHGDLIGCLVGSVASAVASHAHCPVVVVRGETAGPGSGRRVVVGVDGSTTSASALRFAAETADRSRAELTVVCAWHSVLLDSWTSAYWAGVSAETNPDNAAREAAEKVAEESAKAAQAMFPEVAVDSLVGQGNPAAVILAVARDAGLIAMGARGRGSFTSLMLGSVSHQVIHEAPCPVAVIGAHGTSRTSLDEPVDATKV